MVSYLVNFYQYSKKTGFTVKFSQGHYFEQLETLFQFYDEFIISRIMAGIRHLDAA